MANILPLLSTLIPGNLAQKALSKINPNFANFFQGAISAGYATDEALNFLRDKFQNPEIRKERERLETSQTLRPDERASLQTMRQSQSIPEGLESLLKAGAKIGGGLLGVGLGRAEKEMQKPIEQDQPILSAEAQSRKLAGERLSRMKQKKSMIDQLQQEFEQEFGANPLESPGKPIPPAQRSNQQALLEALKNLNAKLGS